MEFNPATDWDRTTLHTSLNDRVPIVTLAPNTVSVMIENFLDLCLVCLSAKKPSVVHFYSNTAMINDIDSTGGELWLNLAPFNQWRKISEWGDTAALIRHEDMPI